MTLPDRLLLDRIAADACPPLEQVEVDGWRLRAADGVLRRANSALPLSDALPLDAVVDFYRSRGLPPRVQVSSASLDAVLAARAWTRDGEVAVLAGPTPTGRTAAVVGPEPDERWLDAYWSVDGRGGAAEREVLRRMLRRIEAPAAYARVEVGGVVVAVGRGVAQERHLGVFAMAVVPGSRRLGFGHEVLLALGTWGASLGAGTTYLQVVSDNLAARALYEGAGLRPVQGYHYRTLP